MSISKIEGYKSNSASPTENFKIIYNDDLQISYNNVIVNTMDAFVKIYIHPDSVPKNYPEMKKYHLEAVYYEYKFYENVIIPLLDYKVTPHFIRYYKLETVDVNTYINQYSYFVNANNIIRNIEYMYHQVKNRPSISNNFDDNKHNKNKLKIPENIMPTLKMSILYSENVDNDKNCTLFDYRDKFYDKTPENMNNLYTILFQIAQACYALELSKSIHNDLHLGNIWIKKREDISMKIRYVINGSVYNIKTNLCCRIYDFDRSYSYKLKLKLTTANILNEVNCETNSQCNYISNCKDFVKVICGIYKCNITLGESLLDLIIPDNGNELKSKLLESFRNSCNLTIQQGGFEYLPFSSDFYLRLNTYPVILQKLYKNINNNFTEEPDFIFTCNKKSFSPLGEYILNSNCCSDI